MDPTGGGGIGKAAGELMKEVQKAQDQMQQLDKSQQVGGGQFDQVMEAQRTLGAENVQGAKEVQGTTKAADVLLQAKVNNTLPSTRVGEAAKAERSKMATMLEQLIGGQDKMTKIMNMALSGRQFSPSELIAMQAGVYRFSQELELTSKVIEKATSGIKQTMNTQV
ncbi:MAG: hypothetical protein HYZ27_04480 [Deltaproteobacteria bacterium]|nr:hypothetical protein [Deltaproteobacteria bacterium]